MRIVGYESTSPANALLAWIACCDLTTRRWSHFRRNASAKAMNHQRSEHRKPHAPFTRSASSARSRKGTKRSPPVISRGRRALYCFFKRGGILYHRTYGG